MGKFSDYVKKETRDDLPDLVPLEEIANKHILILNWRIKPSTKYEGQMVLYFQFKYLDNDDPFAKNIFACFTSASVLIKQLQDNDLPESFDTTIKRIARGPKFYYKFS